MISRIFLDAGRPRAVRDYCRAYATPIQRTDFRVYTRELSVIRRRDTRERSRPVQPISSGYCHSYELFLASRKSTVQLMSSGYR